MPWHICLIPMERKVKASKGTQLQFINLGIYFILMKKPIHRWIGFFININGIRKREK